jgi:structural maintenance of chromosome 4
VLAGIFGRLGDLGTIDQKYDCAVTTACGVLDHIVVDNIANGEKCIAFLREHKIGSGKFICLDKVAQGNRQQREKPF